ncbi:Serine carboxypeptidase, putative [Perkinsus marinus ATCC 50983]|uniref:Serine carboxypeptidase, putative n=1 Tax=Perkinsus marinus (strain ATCC 50983 / TXsc) TaxID=423536 RepID=C5KG08_PERM5|nr:Serine carboxypeptidase, putative [Perkinsus marinus ATCC 50983]EER16572.1 Serine carboxypeptidase, putative [Perkinsus marinus ATCC 50983]|eukprot:XP_002784776.1 Serine carboxypeptidase, putative [Perkinsus marinus ATCC 50983]
MPALVASLVVMLGAQITKNQELKANFRGVMAFSGAIGPSAVYQGCMDMASQRKLVPQDILNIMRAGMNICRAALAECNSNGPGKPAAKDKCLNAVKLCDSATVTQLRKTPRSIYDVRTEDGRESRFYKFNPGNVEKLLNRKNVQDELGVAKSFQMQNDHVFSDFRPYAAYDTTYFVNELLDQGMKVFILNGAEDFVTNYGGTEKWVFSLNGQINYGSKLSSSLRRTLQFPRVGVFGKYYRYSFANGAHLAVINVINSGHDMILDAPEGMQQAFNSFLSGQLWQG